MPIKIKHMEPEIIEPTVPAEEIKEEPEVEEAKEEALDEAKVEEETGVVEEKE